MAQAGEDAAVSDIIGSILLVGITVVAAAAFGIVLLAFDGPADQLHVDIELRTTPGADGLWDTGDERMELVHLGGEPLLQSQTTLTYTADGTQHRYSGSTLGYVGSAFADDGDGRMTIGEVWTSPAAAPDYLDVAQDEAVTASLVSSEDISQLVAAGTVTGGGIVLDTSVSCTPDITDPTVVLSKTPTDLTSSSGTTAVVVTAVGSDACNAVDTTVAPHLWYRISPGPLPGPAAYTDAGAMTYVSGTTWTKTVTAPAGGWVLAWGQTLQLYVTGVKDTAPTPNTLTQSQTLSDAVDLVGSSHFVQTHDAIAGTFVSTAPFANLGANDNVEAQVLEACNAGAPISNVQSLCGSTAGGSGVTSAAQALRSDDLRSSNTGPGTAVQVSGFDVPGEPASITGFTISYEGQRGTGGSTNPTVQLEYQFDATCASAWTSAGSTFGVTTTSDSTTTRNVGGVVTIAEVESLCVRALVTNAANRPLLTDALTVSVTYSGATTTHDLNLELGWTSLNPLATSGLLDIEYNVASGESYTVEKFNGLTWTACAGAMTSTTAANFQCTLSLAELLVGSPLVRIVGTVDAGAASTLEIDYVRLAVFT